MRGAERPFRCLDTFYEWQKAGGNDLLVGLPQNLDFDKKYWDRVHDRPLQTAGLV